MAGGGRAHWTVVLRGMLSGLLDRRDRMCDQDWSDSCLRVMWCWVRGQGARVEAAKCSAQCKGHARRCGAASAHAWQQVRVLARDKFPVLKGPRFSITEIQLTVVKRMHSSSPDPVAPCSGQQETGA